MTSPFLSKAEPICPPDLLARALSCETPRVAIAAAGFEVPMQAAKRATELGLMVPVFTGKAAKIEQLADALDWDISAFRLIKTDEDTAAAYAAARACADGEADILMKGGLHSDTFLKAALGRNAGLRTSARLVHIFHISPPDGGAPILISDGAMNVRPNLRTRKTATREVVTLLNKLGNSRPKIAFLSATETPINSVPSSTEARDLRDWAQATIPNADFYGPLALDLILSQAAATIKGLKDDPATRRTDAVIVPDIVSGNVLFKALVYLAGGCAAGLITGAKVPLLLTSRADPAAARLASIALAVVARAEAGDAPLAG